MKDLHHAPLAPAAGDSPRPPFGPVLRNSGWLFADRLFRLLVGFTLSIWIARVLGPHDYGSLSYAAAFVSMFATFATLGLDAVVVRELAINPTRMREVLGSVLALKLVAGFVAYLLVLGTGILLSWTDRETFYLIAIAGCALVLQSADVFDFWFQSQVQSRYVVASRLSAFVVLAAVKIWLLVSGAGVTSYAWASMFELALAGLALLLTFQLTGHALTTLRVDWSLAKDLLRQSWPLALSGMFVLLTMQFDKILLDRLSGRHAVGLYSVAGQLSTVWYMVPMIIGASVAPGFARAYASGDANYERDLRRIYASMTYLSVFAAILVTLASERLVDLLFGSGYAGAGPVLAVHIWGAVFVFHVSIRTRALVVESKQRFVTAIAALTLVTSIGLNWVLIDAHGALGAAWASLISWALCATVFAAIWPETRRSAVMFLTSFRV